MSNTIWDRLAETPWWIYLLCGYLIRISFLATKPQMLSLRKLLILPSLFTAISLLCIVFMMPLTFIHIGIWLASLLLGAGLGWLQFQVMNIQAIKNENKLYVPGTWSFFIILFSLFAIQYYTGYQLQLNPDILTQPKYAFLLLSFYGLFSGIFIGRIAYSLRCLKVGPFMVPS